jgi:polysaccharide biosynthesis protein PelC
MKRWLPFLLVILTLTGCTTLHQGSSAPVSLNDSWALLPFINNTETPYAGERAESVTATLLLARGVQRLERYTVETKTEELGNDRGERRQREALEWAKQKKVRFVLSGTVNEWRYKVGLDGEPVAGIAMQLIELPEGKVVWSGTAGKSGWSRDAVSAVAQQVLDRLLETIRLDNGKK